MVYLVHFRKKLKHAQHYLGFTGDLRSRMARHRAGAGSRLLRAASAKGISYSVVRTWKGRGVNRDFERRLKNSYTNKELCPTCSGAAARRRGNV